MCEGRALAECEERFDQIISHDFGGGEPARAHSLTVTCYLVQHPESPRAGAPHMHGARIAALVAWARAGSGAIEQIYRAGGAETLADEPARAGELTIWSLDPDAGPGHAARVERWGRSVAQRWLGG